MYSASPQATSHIFLPDYPSISACVPGREAIALRGNQPIAETILMSGTTTDPMAAMQQAESDMQATYAQAIGEEQKITDEKTLFDVALDAAKQRPQI
jgi:hypothetical protein